MRTKCQRNNNPVNLRYAKQKEAAGKDLDGFAVFPTPEAGWRAAHRQIKLDQGRGLTLGKFLHKFAPTNENDTEAYLEFVCKEMDCVEEYPLSQVSYYALAGVLACYEGYYK